MDGMESMKDFRVRGFEGVSKWKIINSKLKLITLP